MTNSTRDATAFEKWWKHFWISSLVDPSRNAKAVAWAAWDAALDGQRGEPTGAFCPVDGFCERQPICPWPCKKLRGRDVGSTP